MAELLFEIFCEEIPARMQVRAGEDLSKALTDGMKKAGLSVEAVQVMTGPRRLVFAADVPLRSPDVSEERKGPRVGSPEKALAGFLRGAGLSDISEAEIRIDPKKGEFYVAILNSEGRDTKDILAELIPDVMQNFPWPKSMKSGASTFRWVRPLQSLLCLLNGEVVPFEVGGINSGDVTEGHRKHGKGPFKISGLDSFVNLLENEGHVVLSAEKRKDIILTAARKACDDKGLELVEDEGLLNEVAGLAEWPVVILGDMDPSFLELPSEVIRLSMRTHQKYFAVRNPKMGELAPHFIVVANQAAPDGGKAIAAGNSRVLSARLADAQFFQSEDAKKNLEDYYEKLDTVVFHKKLGSIKDKAERVAALARELAPIVGADAEKAEKAAKLAKCDLVTNMVVEFTSLEGQIGRLMYEREGGDKDIAMAIEDHYKPKGPSDDVPTNPVAVAVALADKLDTLVGFWAIDEKPTGSKDPFALRRAALGVVRIILENDVRVKISNAILRADVKKYEGALRWDEGFTGDPSTIDLLLIDSVSPDLFSFIADRLKVYLKDKGIRHDLIDAVFAPKENGEREDDLVAIVNRVTALQKFLSTDEGENLLAGYKRAANILKAEAKKGDLPEGAPNRPDDAYGAALYDALQSSSKSITAALETEDFDKAMFALAELRAPIDDFFTNVQVISDDIAVRENNLRLLRLIRDTSRQIADFEAING
ncbi:glycyl-tRNA synthetase beta chain [Litorimonas taeanensis]|uniref:Glycine--tRNA ligase beta subunit n=1 Tax=Litorimonas taeanensis TaxID=568099 RepID=A0A420WIZ4_9PROT|nr:glycine--tRNA ligase subunit beta [Litorimonas taeanensis]RKQ71001.1 glycyl-tRNA synthetase beta chain [Litorimonas taeanensis]